MHGPLEAPTEYLDLYPGVEDPQRRLYLAMVSAMDHAVGTVSKIIPARIIPAKINPARKIPSRIMAVRIILVRINPARIIPSRINPDRIFHPG